METGTGDVQKKMDELDKQLADSKLQVQQLDAKNRSLQTTIESQEKQKRQLEDELDGLNAKLANVSGSGPKNDEAQQQQQKLVAQLRDQIALKNSEIKKLTVYLIILLAQITFLLVIFRNHFKNCNFLVRNSTRTMIDLRMKNWRKKND